MTDLNTLIPSGSDLFLPEARDVNSRGQIVGPAMQISTGEIHAFLATPSNGEDGESAPPAAQGQSRRGARIILPVHVRKMLRDSLAKPYPRGGLGGWNLK